MSTIHIFTCINKKCKRYGKEQRIDEYNSMERCHGCKKVMRYQGEQGQLGFEPECTCDMEKSRRTTHLASCRIRVKRLAELGVPSAVEEMAVAHSAEVKHGLDAVGYELVNAVFSVKSSYRGSRGADGMPLEEVLTVVQPMRIYNNMSRGYALSFARKHIMDYYRTSQVVFLHWADAWVVSGGFVEVQ